MIVVYSKTVCPYCTEAKYILDKCGIEYTEVNVDTDSDARDFITSAGFRTVPQIFLDDVLLVEGGCFGLKKLSKEELLAKIDVMSISKFELGEI